MTRSKFSLIIIALSMLLQVTAAAQRFKYSAILNQVSVDGFYRIMLNADVLGNCNTDLTDLRILDATRQQIPYLMHKDETPHVAYKEQIITSFTPVSTSGYSTITLIFRDPIPIEKLRLNISYPKYYQRSMTLMTSEDTGKTLTEVAMGTITSFGNNTVHFGMIKSRYLQLSVKNDDNPPLSISSISLGYMPSAIVAYLEKGKAYTLNFGNDYLRAPNYDLGVFKDKIPVNIRHVTYAHIKATYDVQKSSAAKNRTSARWMWVSLCAALVVLGYFTFRLMRDMKKTN